MKQGWGEHGEGYNTAMIAVAPPGGWVVRVSCMAKRAPVTAQAQARARLNPVSSGAIPEASIILATQVPQKAEMSCPKKKFLGWARGDSMLP